MSRARAFWVLALLTVLAGCAGSNRRNPPMLPSEPWSDAVPPEVLGDPFEGGEAPAPEILDDDPGQPRGLSRYFPSLFGRRRAAPDWFEGQAEPRNPMLSDRPDLGVEPGPRDEPRRPLAIGRRIFQRQPLAQAEPVEAEPVMLPTLPVSLVLETYPDPDAPPRSDQAFVPTHNPVPERRTSMETGPILAVDPASVAWPGSLQDVDEHDPEWEAEAHLIPSDEMTQGKPPTSAANPPPAIEVEEPSRAERPRFQALYARKEPGSLPPDLPNALFPPSYYDEGHPAQTPAQDPVWVEDRPRPRLLERAATLRRWFDARTQNPEKEILVEIQEIEIPADVPDSASWEQDEIAQGG